MSLKTLKYPVPQAKLGSAAFEDVSAIVDIMYPIGYQYKMYSVVASNDPDDAFPVSERPESLYPGTTWELLWNNEGVFFRTEGDTDTRTDGLQEDQMQGHIQGARDIDNDGSSVSFGGGGTVSQSGVTRSGTNLGEPVPNSRYAGATGEKLLLQLQSTPENDGTNGEPRTGAETRPVNRLMRIYRRTA